MSERPNDMRVGEAEQASAQDDLLRDALALPREVAPPRGMWSGIEARIEAKRRRVVTFRRGVTGASLLLAAAAVVLSLRSANHLRESPAPATIASDSVETPSTGPADPPDLGDTMEEETAEMVPEEASYRVALAALSSVLDEQSKALPDKDRRAFEASLAAIDAAIAMTRTSLREHPEDADLRAELDAEYEQKIDAMNDVLEWTTRS